MGYISDTITAGGLQTCVLHTQCIKRTHKREYENSSHGIVDEGCDRLAYDTALPGTFRRKMLPPFSMGSENRGSIFLQNVHNHNDITCSDIPKDNTLYNIIYKITASFLVFTGLGVSRYVALMFVKSNVVMCAVVKCCRRLEMCWHDN